jgi:hypothetical protein
LAWLVNATKAGHSMLIRHAMPVMKKWFIISVCSVQGLMGREELQEQSLGVAYLWTVSIRDCSVVATTHQQPTRRMLWVSKIQKNPACPSLGNI